MSPLHIPDINKINPPNLHPGNFKPKNCRGQFARAALLFPTWFVFTFVQVIDKEDED